MRLRRDWRLATKWIIGGVVLFGVTWDMWVYVAGGYPATISHVVLGWSQAWPVVPFAVGVLCGHLFWPQYREKG